ncbi:MAG: hypothetical protein O7A64_07975, partial [Alphaproteobacteria bacterium]|nr:hypothetical protein [Alphaproteobacteria bacterium]
SSPGTGSITGYDRFPMTGWRPGRTAISSSGTYRHLLLLVFLATLWSSSFAAIKIAVGTIPPLTLAAGRIGLAAVVLYAFIPPCC